jgi:hypothetical protein
LLGIADHDRRLSLHRILGDNADDGDRVFPFLSVAISPGKATTTPGIGDSVSAT